MYNCSFIIKTVLVPIAAVLFGIYAFPSHAQSQDNASVQNRLGQIERQLETLSRQIYGGGGVRSDAGGNMANMEIRLSQLESEIRRLTGQIERQSFLMNQMETRFQKRLDDLKLRIDDLEQGGIAANAPRAASGLIGSIQRDPQGMHNKTVANTSASPESTLSRTSQQDDRDFDAPAPITPETVGNLGTLKLENGNVGPDDGAVEQVAQSPEAHYDKAFAFMKDREYDQAERQFRAFIEQYPGHDLVENAYYWLGETYYVREQYERAARLFATGYKNFPEGNKAPDNLLKLGLSLNGLGNREDACIALIQLDQKFPNAAGPVSNRADQEISRLGCDT